MFVQMRLPRELFKIAKVVIQSFSNIEKKEKSKAIILNLKKRCLMHLNVAMVHVRNHVVPQAWAKQDPGLFRFDKGSNVMIL